MSSEDLQQLAWNEEDEGKEVYVYRHESGIIEYIEVNGKEYVNPTFMDEVRDAHETESGYRMAEKYWQE